MEVCPQHGELLALLKRVEEGQKVSAVNQSKMFTSIAVMETILEDLKNTKAVNCGPRIEKLESNTDACRELRAGPRIDELETNQSKAMIGTVKIVVVAFISAMIGAWAKVTWK